MLDTHDGMKCAVTFTTYYMNGANHKRKNKRKGSQIPERTKEFPLQERTQNCSQTEAVHSISQFVSSALAQTLDLDLDRLIQIRINIKRPVHYRKGPDWTGFRSDGKNLKSNGALMWTMWTLSLPSFCSLPSQKNPHLMQKSGQKDAKPKFLSPVES